MVGDIMRIPAWGFRTGQWWYVGDRGCAYALHTGMVVPGWVCIGVMFLLLACNLVFWEDVAICVHVVERKGLFIF